MYLCNTTIDNKSNLHTMRTTYIIKSQTENEVSIYATATNKREIESRFNMIMRLFKRKPDYFVENINIGYSKVTYYGTFGRVESEFWIERA